MTANITDCKTRRTMDSKMAAGKLGFFKDCKLTNAGGGGACQNNQVELGSH